MYPCPCQKANRRKWRLKACRSVSDDRMIKSTGTGIERARGGKKRERVYNMTASCNSQRREIDYD